MTRPFVENPQEGFEAEGLPGHLLAPTCSGKSPAKPRPEFLGSRCVFLRLPNRDDDVEGQDLRPVNGRHFGERVSGDLSVHLIYLFVHVGKARILQSQDTQRSPTGNPRKARRVSTYGADCSGMREMAPHTITRSLPSVRSYICRPCMLPEWSATVSRILVAVLLFVFVMSRSNAGGEPTSQRANLAITLNRSWCRWE